MAEIGIIASVIQIADTGLRLSIKLYTFGEVVASADKSVISISKDVSLTSSVLKELGQVLENDEKNRSQFLTHTAIKTADDVVKECLEVFEDMENIIVKKLPSLGGPGLEKASKAAVLLERLKWPYLQPKLQLLQSNLDRLKSTILLMLNVITYARQVISSNESESVLADQKSLVEDLAQTNQDYIKKFESLKLSIEGKPYAPTTIKETREDTMPSQPNASLIDSSSNPTAAKGALDTIHHLLCTYVGLANDPRFIQLHHYYEMLSTMLKEIDETRYAVQIDSRSRVRKAIHNTFEQEILILAHPFGEDLSKQMCRHFAYLVAASRNKWSPFEIPDQASTSLPSSTFAPSKAYGHPSSVDASSGAPPKSREAATTYETKHPRMTMSKTSFFRTNPISPPVIRRPLAEGPQGIRRHSEKANSNQASLTDTSVSPPASNVIPSSEDVIPGNKVIDDDLSSKVMNDVVTELHDSKSQSRSSVKYSLPSTPPEPLIPSPIESPKADDDHDNSDKGMSYRQRPWGVGGSCSEPVVVSARMLRQYFALKMDTGESLSGNQQEETKTTVEAKVSKADELMALWTVSK